MGRVTPRIGSGAKQVIKSLNSIPYNNDFISDVIFLPSTKKIIKSIELDGGIFMDYTPSDNIWKE